MSKRNSQSNTLFNYFQSPKQAKTPTSRISNIPSDDSDNEVLSAKKKRTRVFDSDSDSENVNTVQTPKKPKVSSSHSVSTHEDNPTKQATKLQQFTFSSDTSSSKESSIVVPDVKPLKIAKNEVENETRWLHETLDFIQPKKIRDANKRRPNDPDYDSTTLHVPADYLNTLTPAMRQWWQLKSQHYDTVLFFKVGKFYELYHMDATVGVEHLGFTYMKGTFAHSGFPEIAYGRMAQSLCDQGFKVARVEQTETPEMMTERCKTIKATKFDKVVNREICQVSMKGVCLHGVQTLDIQQAQGSYMIAICEQVESSRTCKHFGVCFIDISIGVFYLAEFDDDLRCSRLLTLMAHHNPALILLERGGLKNDTMEIIGTHLKDVKKEILKPGKQFLDADATVDQLKRGNYFKDAQEVIRWPELFNELLADSLVKTEFTYCMKSLGACIWYLKKSLLDIHVLQMKKFEKYVPIDLNPGSSVIGKQYMVIDNVSLENLHLLGNEGTLQKTLDYCCTSFGKRLLQMWICKPLCDITGIEKRQGAVRELYNNYELLKNTRELLSKLPDIERQIVKIHRFGNARVAEEHPDSRAVLYEAKTYSKRKIQDLMSTLEAFELIVKLTGMYADCESRLLQKLTQFEPAGTFVDLREHLKFFKCAFDQKQAKEEGTIIPGKGVDKEYDDAQNAIKEIQKELDDYLDEQCNFFKCEVKYFGNDKKRFQLEVPEHKCNKVTREYQLEGTRKGSKPCKRYSTSVTKNLLAKMIKAEGERAKIVQDLNRRIFEKFGDRVEDWEKSLLCVMILDCLCALAEYARLRNDDICMPKVHPFSDKPICKMENARHPCINTEKCDFVPNDVYLGENKQPVMILTGPNMGGKSTFMRQTVLISIMAQIGSYVPASECEISLIDRIFTRMGAQDDIMKGQSTFLVELMEASTILKHANQNSFVLLDELGRGTSTHDGNAIARGYLRELSNIKCRGVFATHYHSLVQKFDHDENIQLGYMTCMLENEGKEDERVIFLYKVEQGLWPKSYGFHVASLAGMPKSIVQCGRKFAIDMELKDQNRNIIQNLSDVAQVFKILSLGD